jgi:hypothetical protein
MRLGQKMTDMTAGETLETVSRRVNVQQNSSPQNPVMHSQHGSTDIVWSLKARFFGYTCPSEIESSVNIKSRAMEVYGGYGGAPWFFAGRFVDASGADVALSEWGGKTTESSCEILRVIVGVRKRNEGSNAL